MFRAGRYGHAALCFGLVALIIAHLSAGQRSARPQALDEVYTAKIKEYTQDSRIITELVDHLPASDTVPSPLKVLGRIPGTPDEVTYSRDVYRYFDELDKASDRVKVFRIGQTEEGRDQIVAAVGDAATLKQLEAYKAMTARLTDPRKLTDADARRLIGSAKPIYYVTGTIHSPEMGSPEMLMELAYRLAVEETPFIQQIRNNVIVAITPIVEVDGRDKAVDSWYFRKRTGQTLPLMYWGKYVAHDNNRDGMGQALKLTQNLMAAFLDWHPTVLHDLHESQPYLYTSTGTGPYNLSLDPLVTDEWWILSKYEIGEMTKRGVPGIWTWGFYDGWVPNYLFFIANSHNAIGRFYETQLYGPMNQELALTSSQTSREWYRPNPPLPRISWGPRNNVNMQQSALLFALSYVAKNREWFLENYWLKNKRSVEKGRGEAPYAWVLPAAQRRRVEAAELVNLLRRQGAEVHVADKAFSVGGVPIAAGDYILRADQPFRTLIDMYFSVQQYAGANPRPYDDTGWTFQYLRNVQVTRINDRAILEQPMTLLAKDAEGVGQVTGVETPAALVIENTTDNTLATFRFLHKDVSMRAAERDIDAVSGGLRAGDIAVSLSQNVNRSELEASIKALGLTAHRIAAIPDSTARPPLFHDLDVPRIGFVHSWVSTQDEGWWRIAFDRFKVPYDYFADQKLKDGGLRDRYDVIVYPHVGGPPQSHINGVPMTGQPLPYKRTPETPNLGVQDQSDDIRGGMGVEGFAQLVKFVEDGGTLIVEGSTLELMSSYGVTSGVTIERPANLFVRGSIIKGLFADATSPIAYGFHEDALPVYFSEGPVVNAGGVPLDQREPAVAGTQIPGVGLNLTPNAQLPPLATMDAPARSSSERPSSGDLERFRQIARAVGVNLDERQPRVVLRVPNDPGDILLSGALVGGEALAGRALVIDVPFGKGHIVMFAARPFWRSQTQGAYPLVFNTILNWNDLDAGKPMGEPPNVPVQPTIGAEHR